MPPRRRLLLAALALGALLVAGCGPRPIEPEVLRYFSADVVRAHDAYKAPLRWHWAVTQLMTLGFFAAFLGLRLNRRLKERCDRAAAPLGSRLGRFGAVLTRLWGDAGWAGAVLFTVAYLLIAFAISLPGDFYFGWVYQRAHGTSTESLGRYWWDAGKSLFVNALLMAALAFGLFGLARRRRDWWLLLGVPCAVLFLVLGGVLDPLFTQIYYAHEPLPEGPHKERIGVALRAAGVEYEGIYLQKMGEVTRSLNAYLMGDGPTRRIVLYDTLVQALTPAEAASAVAHEAGHLRDRSPGRLVFAAASVVPLLAALAFLLRRLGRSRRLGFEDDRDVASLPMIYLLWWLLGLAAGPVSSAYSRHLEERADGYALALLAEPEAFRSMMVKVARSHLVDLHPPLFWRLLSDHPPVMERIRAAEAFAVRAGGALPEPRPEAFQLPDALDPLKAARR